MSARPDFDWHTWPDYVTDAELERWYAAGIPPERAKDVIRTYYEYREHLREIADYYLRPEQWVSSHHVGLTAWTALKWVDGQERGMLVPDALPWGPEMRKMFGLPPYDKPPYNEAYDPHELMQLPRGYVYRLKQWVRRLWVRWR